MTTPEGDGEACEPSKRDVTGALEARQRIERDPCARGELGARPTAFQPQGTHAVGDPNGVLEALHYTEDTTSHVKKQPLTGNI